MQLVLDLLSMLVCAIVSIILYARVAQAIGLADLYVAAKFSKNL
jgi:hypothetical protein